MDKNKDTRLFYAILVCITCVGAYLRLTHLETFCLWIDESISLHYWLPHVSLERMIHGSVRHNAFPPLDFLINRAIVETLGMQLWTTRLSSALLGIGAIPLLGLFIRRISNAKVGLLTALLFALNPFHLYYSVEARPYSLLVFTAILFAYATYNSCDRGTLHSYIYVFLTVILGCMANYMFLFCLGFMSLALLVWILIDAPKGFMLRRFAYYCIAVFCAVIVVAVIYYHINMFGSFTRNIERARTAIAQKPPLRLWHDTWTIVRDFFSTRDHRPLRASVMYMGLATLGILALEKPRRHTFMRLLPVIFLLAIPVVATIAHYKGGAYVLRARYIAYAQPFLVAGLAYALYRFARGVGAISSYVIQHLSHITETGRLRVSGGVIWVTSFMCAAIIIGQLWVQTIRPTFYGTWQRSVWYEVQDYIESITNRLPVTVFSYVLYDNSAAFHFNHFISSPYISVEHRYAFDEYVPKRVFHPHLDEYVRDERELVVIVNHNRWRPDPRVFEHVTTVRYYPTVDIFRARRVGVIHDSTLMSAYTQQFGDIFIDTYASSVEEKLRVADPYNRLSWLLSLDYVSFLSSSDMQSRMAVARSSLQEIMKCDTALSAFILQAKDRREAHPLLWHLGLSVATRGNTTLLHGHIKRMREHAKPSAWPLMYAVTSVLSPTTTYEWIAVDTKNLPCFGFTNIVLKSNLHQLDHFYSRHGGTCGTRAFAEYVYSALPEMRWWAIIRRAEAYHEDGDAEKVKEIIMRHREELIMVPAAQRRISRLLSHYPQLQELFTDTSSPPYVEEYIHVQNSDFSAKGLHWDYWGNAVLHTNHVRFLNEGEQSFVQIINPDSSLMGVRQPVRVEEGGVYRLSGIARSAHHDPARIFGGRVAVYLPDRRDIELVWMTHNNTWQSRSVVFTNETAGMATVYAHMGYGGVSATGEFTDVRLERLKP